MLRLGRLLLALPLVAFSSCVLVPRHPPPPQLINDAAPPGFSPGVRMLTVDRRRYMRDAPKWLAELKRAAHGKPVNILALSGGGSGGAFGAGALVGLSEANARPQFQLVTGVSAGALLAPFAFLGPGWDAQLRQVFASNALEGLQRSSKFGALERILFPQGLAGRDPLTGLVKKFVSNAMIDAIAREAATGRMLLVATTDLDNQETVLWNMGMIAEHGGPSGYALFRKILVASASIPGMFPPIMIRVTEGGRTYDDMQVDGSVTTPVFIAPIIAQTTPGAEAQLADANVYVIVNSHLGMQPSATPINTIGILEESFSAQLTYHTRAALINAMALAQRNHMHFMLTDLPTDYRAGGFLDFRRAHLQRLYDYGESCARRGLLWTDAAQSIRLNVYRHMGGLSSGPVCPAGNVPRHHVERVFVTTH